jgi:hypothetical protein
MSICNGDHAGITFLFCFQLCFDFRRQGEACSGSHSLQVLSRHQHKKKTKQPGWVRRSFCYSLHYDHYYSYYDYYCFLKARPPPPLLSHVRCVRWRGRGKDPRGRMQRCSFILLCFAFLCSSFPHTRPLVTMVFSFFFLLSCYDLYLRKSGVLSRYSRSHSNT